MNNPVLDYTERSCAFICHCIYKIQMFREDSSVFLLTSAWRRGGTTYPVTAEYAALQYSETCIRHEELTGLNNHAIFKNTMVINISV